MTAYREMPPQEFAQDAAVKSQTGLALANNPKAIAEGAPGAPPMQVAWRAIWSYEPSADTSEIVFTGLAGQRGVRVWWAAEQAASTGGGTVSVHVRASGGSWREVFTSSTVEAGAAGLGCVELTNWDGADLSAVLQCHVSFSKIAAGLNRSGAALSSTAGSWMAAICYAETWDEIRISTNGQWVFSDSSKRGWALVEAIKRTAPSS